MDCLVIADEFANRLQPWRGPYNRQQLEALAGLCGVTVINPVPWTQLLFDTRSWRLVSRPDDILEGIVIHHPVFWYLPVVGRAAAWRSVLAAARRVLKDKAKGPYDVILATFAYPHGLAAKHLSQQLAIPYVIKVRGSDLHSLPSRYSLRKRTAEAVRDAAAIVAVSKNLAEIAVDLGAKPENVHVLPNGVDADLFPMLPRADARKKLGVRQEGRIVLFVGNLLPVKGVDILIDALQADREMDAAGNTMTLIIAGDGRMRRWVQKRITRIGLQDRVRLVRHIPRDEVVLWMNAANALVLPSRNEGCPNVVLEALCCGTPVVASRVGAVPDLLDETCGMMVEPGNAVQLSRAIRAALRKEWDRKTFRRRIGGRSWKANAAKLYEMLLRVAEEGCPAKWGKP